MWFVFAGVSFLAIYLIIFFMKKEKNEMEEENKMSRFERVEYDSHASEQQKRLREKFKELEAVVEGFKDCRYKSLAFTALEEAYLWFGKAVREQQIERLPLDGK